MTTSSDSNSTKTAQVITLERRGPIRAREVESALASLRWWDGYQRTCDALRLDHCDWLTDGWNDLHEAIAKAPASGPHALLAKARLAHWHMTESGCDFGSWGEELFRSILAGVETQLREAGHV
jgi:hypothetical protein